jgi:AcrR family transcriptional regulator
MARRRTTRKESQAETRALLLEAARHAFARAGYGGASVEVIVAEAGFTKGAFYSNFETKEALFLELLRAHMVAEAEQLERLLAENPTAETIAPALDRWLAAMNADADWCLLSLELQLQARRSPAAAAAYDALLAEHRRRLGQLVSRLFELEKRRPPAKAVDIAGAMMAIAHGLVLQRTRAEKGPDPTGPLIHLVLRSLIDAAPRK